MENSGEVLAILRMGDANAYYHLKPLIISKKVSFLHIVRPKSAGKCCQIENSKYYRIKSRNKLIELFKIYLQSVRIARRRKVTTIVSFFAFPYGIIALMAGWSSGKPVHVSFVGDDWYRYCQAWYGGILKRILRRASLITVTGRSMKLEMVRKGFRAENIFHLPHAIDINCYHDIPPEKRKYDCIFVGDLIHRKRVDLIISAIECIRQAYKDIKLCIVGDGPLKNKFEKEVRDKNLTANIDFVGYQTRPEKFLSDARINLIASDMEGFPFSIVEGIAAGTIPVSTNVGTISDIIKHEKNGLLVSPNNLEDFNYNINRLLTDHNMYLKMRREVLFMRDSFSFETVAILWSEWFERMKKG